MINSVPIFGFQCDLPGVDIINSSGGLLEENEYQTSNSDSRLLSFSMQAKSHLSNNTIHHPFSPFS